MYRPDGWDKIVNAHYPYADKDMEERRQIDDFEAGADAMLEALIKQESTIPYRGLPRGSESEVKQDGWIISIPMEEATIERLAQGWAMILKNNLGIEFDWSKEE